VIGARSMAANFGWLKSKHGRRGASMRSRAFREAEEQEPKKNAATVPIPISVLIINQEASVSDTEASLHSPSANAAAKRSEISGLIVASA